MTTIISQYLLDEFQTIIPLICLMFIVFIDRSTVGRKKILLLSILLVIALFTIFDYAEFTIAALSPAAIQGTNLVRVRFFTSTVCYILRPLLLALMCIYFFNISKFWRMALISPVIITTIQLTINIFQPFVFTIAEDNHFGGSETSVNLSHVSVVLYIAVFIIMSYIELRKASLVEVISISVVLVTIVTGLIIDYMSYSDSFSHAIVIAFAMYYLIILLNRANTAMDQKELELENRKNALMISQIQSHFVFNTLNSIYVLISTDPARAGQMLLNFSTYLKDNINFSKPDVKLITIEDELHHCQIYTDIEAVRFPKISVEYEINDGNYMLPPLIVQPMVENAIKHGVNGKKGGLVTVSLFNENNNHVIIIKDNGRGVPSDNDSHRHSGIGVSNVKSRLAELVNGEFEMDMVEGVGTTITITIPVA